ncbi:SDR family NAD(P)-dependent oxidoreductase [Embleya sp. AB8]|uniref:SDR family NAD(P)-dependent oxidoreductase n=1 Tax=Embleya sp. AB8 TaxID=3156304 RepID=UPI003C74E538
MSESVYSSRTALVTGATDGIGYETALRLAVGGAEVVVHAVDDTHAQAAVERMVADGADRRTLTTAVADFTDLGQVRAMAAEIAAAHPRLDLLVNNAAIAGPERRTLTEDGNEVTWQVNYLAHFLLTRVLEASLAAASDSRVVNVSSSLHRTGNIDWTDLTRARRYSRVAVYAQSQLALAVFAKALAERGQGAVSLHPGTIDTALLPLYGRVGRPVGEGAAAVLNLCHPEHEVVNGGYYDHLTAAEPGPGVLDKRSPRRLWNVSSTLTDLG